jgi:hypothetical protein
VAIAVTVGSTFVVYADAVAVAQAARLVVYENDAAANHRRNKN